MLKRILVTGGAGFLGSHLCKRLLDDGNEVVCIDNFASGFQQNIESLNNYDRFFFVEHDIIEPISLECDEIYNLACPASPVHYQHDPIRTLKTCVYGSANLLDLANHNNAKILQASTSEVYGDPLVHPQTEAYRGNVNTIGPRSCYDEGKRCAETLFSDYKSRHGVNIRIMRIFNTYGPNMHPADGRVVSNFIVQALRGEDITVYGDGQQTRSFCYVSDLIDGMVRLMNGPDDFAGPVNIGNPGEFTILELAEQIIAKTASTSKIVFKPLPVDDPLQRRPDISLAQKHLGWAPDISLSKGLDLTIPYFAKL